MLARSTLLSLCSNKIKKLLRKLVTKTWQMESAKEKLEASKASQIDIVKTHLTSVCVEGCSGQQLQCAKEVLLLNEIDRFQFVTSIKDLLIHGKGKNRNLIITGPTNCAKAFMLKPLKHIFSDSIFESPANSKYAWARYEKAIMFLLNNFRWSKDLIRWHNMLPEGETLKLPAPKNIYIEDIVISTDVAIFQTSKSSSKYRGSYNANVGRRGQGDRETEMMAVRLKIIIYNYNFGLQFWPEEQKNLPPCPRCFAKLVFFN